MGQIIAAEEFHTAPPGMPGLTPAAWSLVWHSHRFKTTGELPKDKVAKNYVSEVYISASRWCAPCPWCPASEYPSRSDHRFLCSQCHNDASYTWIPTQWPKQWKLIEDILLLRPRIPNRNWMPDEKVQDLAMENELMGIPTFSLLDIKPTRAFLKLMEAKA